MSSSASPLAYFITFRCYGTWLHGDGRGSVDSEHREFGTPFAPASLSREHSAGDRMRDSVRTLSSRERGLIEDTIRDVIRHRGWCLSAVNVQRDHVHLVVSASDFPERMLTTFKAWATRRMVEAGMRDRGTRVWSRHGSTRYLWSERDVESACSYVLECQN